MSTEFNYPFFTKAEVRGLTIKELEAVGDLMEQPGWKPLEKFLATLLEPAQDAVYANGDPQKQLLLHQGLGMIYVAGNLLEFVSSSHAEALRLLQQEESAPPPDEQTDSNAV